MFRRLAEVEASAHGVPVEDVEFHEVGSWDSVADVVGTCAALHLLDVEDVVATRIALGSGTVRTVHGLLPVPVPAVLGLVDGWQVEAGGDGELATPTGVALVTTYATAQGPLPALDVVTSGVGAGTRDPAGRPNVVRVVLGTRPAAAAPDASRSMVVLEANVDDIDPRVWPTVLTALMDAGAADAWLTPILMKKGRPAHTLSVLGGADQAPALRDRILRLTSTIGVRQTIVERWALDRGWVDVDVDGHTRAGQGRASRRRRSSTRRRSSRTSRALAAELDAAGPSRARRRGGRRRGRGSRPGRRRARRPAPDAYERAGKTGQRQGRADPSLARESGVEDRWGDPMGASATLGPSTCRGTIHLAVA